MKKAFLLLNGSSGMGKVREYTFSMIEQLHTAGYDIEVWPIIPAEADGMEDEILKRAKTCDLLVCCGGDGTMFHLINMLMKLEKRPVIGYVPTGSTNDFARGIGLGGEMDVTVPVLTSGRPLSYDIGKMNGIFFNYVAAFGAFAAVSYSTDQNVKNMFGHTAYALNGLSHLGENLNARIHLRITTDTFTAEGDYIFGAIYNSVSIGGFVLTPYNTPNNGKFHLLLIKAPDNISEASSIFNALTTLELTDCPEILYREITRAEISFDQPTDWTLDGEFGGSIEKAVFEVIPKAVTILVPRD